MSDKASTEPGRARRAFGKILVVDDDETIRAYLVLILSHEGYKVLTAKSARDAYRVIVEEQPDLVLLDLGLPDADGTQVCRTIKEDPDTMQIPVIIITGRNERELRISSLEAGVDDFLTKPVDKDELLARVRVLLRMRRLMLQNQDNERIQSDFKSSIADEQIRGEEAMKNRKYYKDIIYAVTGGKLQIQEKEEIEPFLDEGELLGSLVLNATKDVGEARHMVVDVFDRIGFDPARRDDMVLCVSEAATNVIRHAKEGEMNVRLLADRIRVWVIDYGEGIDFANLPKLALMKGFSTKISLGCGYTLMLELLDRVILSSDKGGTTLVLEMLLSPPSVEESVEALLSRWEGAGSES